MTRIIVATLVALMAVSSAAAAQDYPDHPIKFMHGFPPGGNVDIIGRLLGNEMSKGLGQSIIIEPKPGVAGSLAAVGTLSMGAVRKVQAGPPPPPGAAVTVHKNVCTHCSVGCTVIAHVANGVWIEQEPAWDSPINRGSHCAKGASVRELVHGDRRLKYPMKLVNGQWTRIGWDQAINEIGDKLLSIREKSGPDSVFWLGSAKFSN